MEQIEDNLLFEQVDKALRKNEPVNIRLFSQSMYPFLNPYTDILTLSPSDTNRLHIGDVVLAKM